MKTMLGNIIKTPPKCPEMEQWDETNEVTFNGHKTQDQYLDPNNNGVKDEEEMEDFSKSTHLTGNNVSTLNALCLMSLK